MRHPHSLRAAAGLSKGFDPNTTQIGDAVEGGFFVGFISHTANGVATHALFVAPQATGATGIAYPTTAQKKWQNSSTSTGATSIYDGAANTALMTNSPAASFCTGLSIGGYNDWYLPARYEMAIAHNNLKPDSDPNNTSWGINNYSVPKRTSNNTSSSPAQTSVTAFQSGSGSSPMGSEAFYYNNHWTSTEGTSSTSAWLFTMSAGKHFMVTQTYGGKQTSQNVRAFRKIAV